MSKKVLFIVGSLRQGSFNHQLATQAENILADKAEVSYLDFKDVLSTKILKAQLLRLLPKLVKKFSLLMLSGSSHQPITGQFQELLKIS